MEPFPLFDLNTYTLEKILRKLNSKSFRRLQQTSWEAWGTIQKNSKISVFADEIFSLEYDGTLHFSSSSYQGELDPRGMYATRIGTLQMTGNKLPSFEYIYELLQRYRITCKAVNLVEFGSLTNEECNQLLDILKPEQFATGRLNKYGGTGCCQCLEAVYSSTALLKDITLAVEYSSCEIAVSKLLITCHGLKIVVADFCHTEERDYEVEEHLSFFQRILKILISQPRPNLQNFKFIMRWPRIAMFDPTDDEMKQYSAIVNWNNGKIRDWLQWPENKFSSDSFCKADLSLNENNRIYTASICFNNFAKSSP